MQRSTKYCIKSGKKCKKLNHSQIRRLCCKRTLTFKERPFFIIILGAGAAKIWGGPLCEDIDNIFIRDTTFSNPDGRTIGDIIFEKLKEYYGRNKFVNFETFINFLELIYDYIISESNEGGTDPTNTSMLPLAFDPKELFDLIYNEANPRINQLLVTETDAGVRKRVYFAEMLKHYLNLVKAEIDKYENAIDYKSEINTSVLEWLSELSKVYNLRIYTTNYDRIIPELLEQNNIPCFDGFQKEGQDGRCQPDQSRICNNSERLIYYQLHGSNLWEINDHDFSPFDYQLVRDGIPRNEYTFHLSSQPGQVLLKTSIVAGYSKPQRLILAPINAMYSSFIHDCYRSNCILSVGFSFGDPHLKKVLINCLSSTNIKFINITSCQSIDEVEAFFETGIYEEISRSLGIFFNTIESVLDRRWVIKDKRYFSYIGRFESFLENKSCDTLINTSSHK